MKRLAETSFQNWLHKIGRQPLVVRGARQVGKSTLVRRPPLDSARGLLFLDEIQAAPAAIAALRYFHEERPDVPVVAAGSLLEFALSEHAFSMPVGRVDYYHLGPMTFGEFLVAAGQERLDQYLQAYRSPADFSPVAHERLMTLLRDYLFTGGMPEAVQSLITEHNPESIGEIHRSILNTYRDDFANYAGRHQLQRLRRVFEYVPASVGRKFVYAQVNRDWKAGDVRSAVDLLAQAGIIHRVHHVSGAGIPLGASAEDRVFKPLFLDVGLMNTACGGAPLTLEQCQSQRFLHEGPLAEQFIGQHLLCSAGPTAKPERHYWLREGKNANAEVDYVIQAGRRVVPVEVKAGASGSLRSLHQFAAAYAAPLALRFDVNPPSVQHVRHSAVTPRGRQHVAFDLLSLPLYQVEHAAGTTREFVTTG